MNEDRKKILEMLSEGKITVEEAEKLISALHADSPGTVAGMSGTRPADKSKFKYLRVLVEPGPNSDDNERVNVRIPLNLIKAGLKWAAFIPQSIKPKVDAALKDQGVDIDLSKMKPEDLEELITNLNDLTVEVEGKEKVRVFCE
ncbi:MAG: hypothetical protein JW755_13855 [Candidatus Aminicenantes bacterium]|nr:hypothetical protein [Candidatus Aminicenantes bacterium]